MRETEKNDLSLSICVNREYRKKTASLLPLAGEEMQLHSPFLEFKKVSHTLALPSCCLTFPILPTTHPSVPSTMILTMSSFAFQFPCCLPSWLCHALHLPPTPCATTPPFPSLSFAAVPCNGCPWVICVPAACSQLI